MSARQSELQSKIAGSRDSTGLDVTAHYAIALSLKGICSGYMCSLWTIFHLVKNTVLIVLDAVVSCCLHGTISRILCVTAC